MLKSNQRNSRVPCVLVLSRVRRNYRPHFTQIFSFTENSGCGRLFRWSLQLQHLKFNVIHKPGKANTNADSLSRLDYGPPPASDPDDELLNDSFEIATLEDNENQVNILTLTENEYDEYYK